MSDVEIIPIDLSNIPIAIQVFARARNSPLDVEQSLIESTTMFYKKNNFTGIAITLNKTIIAFAGLIGMIGKTAWIPYVGVDPDYQGQGYGRILMENLLKLAKKNYWKSLELVASEAGFPVYRKFNFRTDYHVASYEIKSIETDTISTDLLITEINKNQNLPSWVLKFDQSVFGIDRSNIFPIHNYNKIFLITKANEGYGIVYGKRIGPIIANSIEIARDIIIKGFSLGGESVILINEPKRIDFFKKEIFMEMIPKTISPKMSFGELIPFKKEYIFGLRTMAYG